MKSCCALYATLVLLSPCAMAGLITNSSFDEATDHLSFQSTWLWVAGSGPSIFAQPVTAGGPTWDITLEGLATTDLRLTYFHRGVHTGEVRVTKTWDIPNVFSSEGNFSIAENGHSLHLDRLDPITWFTTAGGLTSISVKGSHVSVPEPKYWVLVGLAITGLRSLRRRT